MRKIFFILTVVLLLFAISGLAFAGGKDDQTIPSEGGYVATNSKNTHVLGGKSKNPKGLERAAERSNGVRTGNETPK